jgi:hypothetical protein
MVTDGLTLGLTATTARQGATLRTRGIVEM